jgi:hypothetical protein
LPSAPVEPQEHVKYEMGVGFERKSDFMCHPSRRTILSATKSIDFLPREPLPILGGPMLGGVSDGPKDDEVLYVHKLEDPSGWNRDKSAAGITKAFWFGQLNPASTSLDDASAIGHDVFHPLALAIGQRENVLPLILDDVEGRLVETPGTAADVLHEREARRPFCDVVREMVCEPKVELRHSARKRHRK